MISLIIPPGEQITKTQKKLLEEAGKASNIKSRVNRQSVEAALTSTRERLKLYPRTPNNGLVIYCGTVFSEDGRSEKKYTIDFEPYKAINRSLYYCGERFDVEPLKSLLEDDQRFGFIVVDGNGSLYGILQGSTRTILQIIKVDLPKKHGRGGQSALRFARLREEKRHNYLRKVAELAVQHFITNDRPNVTGLVLAGSADFKTKLSQSGMFDPRLQEKIVKIVDVSYGFENGFSQAITLSEDALGNVKYVQEKKLISKFFEEINLDSPKIVFGVADTMKMLEMSVIESLFVWENLDYIRVTLKNPTKENEISVVYLKKEVLPIDSKTYKEPKNPVEFQVVEVAPINEWLIENYRKFGAKLQFITDKSQEGFQFVKGFGGCGGFLRYNNNFMDDGGQTGKAEDGEFDPENDFI
jgi:peptide chain release factor subunit 1